MRRNLIKKVATRRRNTVIETNSIKERKKVVNPSLTNRKATTMRKRPTSPEVVIAMLRVVIAMLRKTTVMISEAAKLLVAMLSLAEVVTTKLQASLKLQVPLLELGLWLPRSTLRSHRKTDSKYLEMETERAAKAYDKRR